MLPKGAIKELKQIYFEENNKELSNPEALEIGNNLINLFGTLLKPLSEEELKAYKKIKLYQ